MDIQPVHFVTKDGKAGLIRPLRASDCEDLLKFANRLSRENTFVMLSGEYVSRSDEILFVQKQLKRLTREETIPLVVYVDGKLAANGQIERLIKRRNHVGMLHIAVDKQYRHQGIGEVFLRTLIAKARFHLGIKMVVLNCFENNMPAIGLYKKIGFQRAGLVPQMLFYKNEYIGELTMYLPLDAYIE